MDRNKIRKLVKDMDEKTESAFLEEIIKKRVAKLEAAETAYLKLKKMA